MFGLHPREQPLTKRAISLLRVLAPALLMVFLGLPALSLKGAVRPAKAAAYGESRVTTDPGDQSNPDISGDKIVFMDWRNGNPDIYAHNLIGGIESTVTTDPELQHHPRISGDRIVWEDRRAGNYDIFMFDPIFSLTMPLNFDPLFQGSPDTSGDKIVWQDWRNGNDDIYLTVYGSVSETQITSDLAGQEYPAVDGNIIVWRDLRNDPGDGSADIYAYNTGTGITSAVTSDAADQKYPAVWGDKVVWEDFRNGNADIYMRNLTTDVESKITTNPAAQMRPVIYDDKVVWSDVRNGNDDIYLYSLTTGVESRITTNPGSQINPSIDGNRIVYDDNRNIFGDIYMFTLDTDPPTGSVLINGGADNAGSADLVLSLSATDTGSGVAQMSFSNDGVAWSAWGPFAVAKSWNSGAGGGFKTVWARFRDAMGNESPAYSDSIFVDTQLPGAAGISAPALSTNVSKTKTFPVSWIAADTTPSSGIASYDVQVKTNAGPWTAWKTKTILKTAIYAGVPGNTYYFRARGSDRAGNVGPWSAQKKTIVPYDQNSLITKKVGFAGTINKASSNYYLGTARYSTTAGDVITYSFTGNYFALIGTKGPKFSKAVVIIDGVKKTVDARAASTQFRKILTEKFLAMKKHTVTIKNLGTAGRTRFEVDGNAVGK